MKTTIYPIALPILAAMAFAQDTPPAQPKPTPTPAETPSTAQQPETSADKSATKSAIQSADRIQEMKTQTYSGTLVDASCAGGGSATPAAATSPAPASGSKQGCALSASATEFALQTKDGQTLRFDSVGNARALEAMKAKKKWSESATANKPVRVKVGGIVTGDKLTVVSIN